MTKPAGFAGMNLGRWGQFSPLIPVVAIGLIAAVSVRGFATAPNLIAVVQASAITGIAAIGTAAITISGRFVSLAVEQQAMTAAFVFAAMILAGQPLVVALLAVFAIAALLGFVQGYLISRGLNPIVTTLAFGSVLFGVVVWLADNRTLTLADNPMANIGGGLTFGIPNQALIFLVVLAIGTWFLSRTTLGRQIVLTGANTKAAELIGIPTRKIIIIAFIIASLLAALAGVLVVGQVSQAKSDMFDGLTIDVVAAILVGGIAIQGGEGQLWRAGLGAIVLTMLGNIMLLLGIDAGMRELAKGILAGAVLLTITLMKERGR
jgi:ribose/xylose/arabinose/galactoside ABC-type transport system permease subunit